MNVLLTSVGRRTYLVDYFKQVLRGRGKVFATNSSWDSSGMWIADQGFLVPPACEPGYLEEILRICAAQDVCAVFSLHDWEAPFLAAGVEQFRRRGIVLGVSRPEVIEICLDKIMTSEFAQHYGFAAPKTYKDLPAARAALQSGNLCFPLIMKPRRGQGSIGLELIEEAWELEPFHRRGVRNCGRMSSNGLTSQDGAECLLIQERLTGIEYGLDVVNDLEGRFVCCLVKQKVAMRSGETDAAVTVRDDALEAFGRRVGESLGHVGMLDVDVIVQGGIPHLLEMNPRFGGHYPFSHAAGANIPAALMAWVAGQPAHAEWLQVEPGVKCFKGITLIKASCPA
jgi:carbamoyl-phosphate synthase large subunit